MRRERGGPGQRRIAGARALAGAGGLGAALAIAIGAGAFTQEADDFRSAPFLRIDPERTLVTDARAIRPCGECHSREWEVWRESKHAQGFDDMHRSPGARDIMQEMGLRVTKRQEALCMRCHYTVGANRQAVAGVSCESCHGPARDWIEVHNRWGPGATGPHDESPDHREQRLAAVEAAGMLRPSGNIYGVAANCFECHTVPMEDLVNRGGHSTGTAGFELVKRVDEIRHNFLETHGDGATNRPLTPERSRVLFTVGRILGYEYAVRGLAEATASGRYATAMGRRATEALRNLEEVAAVSEIAEVLEVLRIGRDLRLVPENEAELARAAEQIRELGQRFAGSADGSDLAELDPLIAGERPVPPAGVAGPPPDAPAPDPAAAPAADPAAPEAPAAAPEPAPRPELPGRVQNRPPWFPSPGQYSVVGAGRCASCHGGAEDWWFADPHERAGRRLLGEDPKARQIAELYGIGPAGMARPDQICMSCHATVDPSSRALREDGVSCESCHGPGSGYLEPHEDGGNPQLGMTALKQASARAETCARCHHISDERLLAAGHPSGSGYDIVRAMRQVEHWPDRRPDRGRQQRGEGPYPAVADGALQTAFQSAVAGRPIPAVTVVAAAAPAAPAAAPARPAAAAPRPGAVARPAAGGPSVPPRAPASRPPREAPGPVSLDLEPLPPSTEDLTTEELLALAKERIRRIYQALGRGN